MSDYYPEFYLKKRQREKSYRRATVAAVGIIVLFIAAGIAGYFIVNVLTNRLSAPGVTPELANQQQDLAVQAKLENAAVPPDVLATTAPAEPVDLSQVGYSESLPQVSVSLAGAEPKADETAVEETAAEASSDETEQPPAVGREPEGESAAAADEPKPQADEPAARVTPTKDDEAKRKAEQQKRQEDAKRLAEKREAEKRADEKKRREEAKQKEEAAQPAPAKDKDAKPAAKTPSYSYTIYGGTYLSSEAAEADKAKLGALGLSGSIIENAGDYMLLVGKLEDRAGAEALSGKLKGSGFGGAFVTRKAK